MLNSWDNFLHQQTTQISNRRALLVRKPLMNGWTLIEQEKYLDFQNNDYLGLSHHHQLISRLQTAADSYGVGSSGAPTLGGYTQEHQSLCAELAQWLNYPQCLIFNSGYQMNVSIFSALADMNTQIWLDRNCHASHIDGVLLSKAKFTRFDSHNICEMQQKIQSSAKRQLIISEGCYSMDGSNSGLLELIKLKKLMPDKILLIIDDAHGLATLGNDGRGSLEQLVGNHQYCDILLGTFGKAFGSHGGFLCTTREIADYLRHTVRSQIFSTSLPPAIVATSRAALQIIRSPLGNELRTKLKHNIDYFKACAADYGLTLYRQQQNNSPIQLITFNDTQDVETSYNQLFKNNILVGKIKYPTVPQNSPRIRISLSTNHSEADIQLLIRQLVTAINLIN